MEADQDSIAERLVVRAQRGDVAAFVQIVRAFDGDVRAFSHRVLGPAWTEDVLQEAYLRAFRGLPGYRPELGAFRSWLYGIVYRCCLDELRRTRRQPLPWVSSLEELPSQDASEPGVATRDSVWRALGALSVEERGCVVLVDGLGFDYESRRCDSRRAARDGGIPPKPCATAAPSRTSRATSRNGR